MTILKNIMKKFILILAAIFSLSSAAFADRIYNFFGYNCWKHVETHADGKVVTEIRAIYDNGLYYVAHFSSFPEDEYGVCILDNDIYISSNILVHEEENSISFELLDEPKYWFLYKYEIKDNHTRLTIQHNDDSIYEAENLKCQKTSDGLIHTYSDHRRAKTDIDKFETVKCEDYFYNEGRQFLHYGLAFSVYSLLREYYDTLYIDKIQYMQLPELRIMRNALYAINGYSFKSKELKELFSHFSWYAPCYTKDADIEFSKKEKELLEVILNRTDELQFLEGRQPEVPVQ